MQLSVRDFTSLVSGMRTAVQAAATQPINLTVGSVMRSLLEATATIGIWFQWLTLQVLTMTRLATSNGADVDSWVADFGMTRLAGVSAVGFVTFSRLSPAVQAVILPGTLVLTGGAAAQFAVTLDTTQPSWNAGLGGYVLAAGATSLTLPAAAVLTGMAGNIQPGGVQLLGQAVPYVDSVTNALAFTGGLNAESDAALRARFQLYVNSRTSGTVLAVLNAVAGYQQGLTALVQENTPQAGFFTVVVDDGSGHPSTALLAGVLAAVNVVRPIGSVANVQGPTVVGVSIGITLFLPASANRAIVQGEVNTAVSTYVAALPVGTALSFGKLASIVYGADTAIQPGTVILLNGAALDVLATPSQVIRVSALAVA